MQPVWLWDSKTGCLQHTGFYHVGTISGKLKVDTIIFVWAWSKIAVVFQFTVPHRDVFWYFLNGMGAQKNAPKKFLVTLFPYIFHGKTKLNIVYEYLKTKIFSKDKYPSPNALNIKYFWTLRYNHWGGGEGLVSLNYQILNFK